MRIKHRVARVFAFVFAGLSFLSVLGEITIFSDIKIVEFTDFTKIGKGFFATQVFYIINNIFTNINYAKYFNLKFDFYVKMT